MNDTITSAEDQPMTFEERKEAMKKLKWSVFKTHVGIPLIGTLALIIIIVILSFVDVPEEKETLYKVTGFISSFLVFAVIISSLWLIVGVLRFIKFIADIPPMAKVILMIIGIYFSHSSYSQQIYTIDSLKCFVVNSWKECNSDAYVGHTIEIKNDMVYRYNTSTDVDIFKMIRKLEPEYVYDKQKRKVFGYKCVDPKGKSCNMFLAIPESPQMGYGVTLSFQYSSDYEITYYLRPL